MPLLGSPDVAKLKARQDVKGLIKALSHRDGKVREGAALALGGIRDVRAVDPLVAALGDAENTDVRRAAARALGEIGDRRAIAPLIARLRDADEYVRERAATALDQVGWQPDSDELVAAYWAAKGQWDQVAAIGAPAVGLLVASIKATPPWKPEVRAIIAALEKVSDARAVEPLVAALDDEAPLVRQAVAAALGQIGDVRAIEPLIAALGDEMEGVRGAAAAALGRIGDVRAVEPLFAVLQGAPSSAARRAAAGLLGQFGDQRAVKPLIVGLQDEDGGVRREAIEALGRFADVRAVEPLVHVLSDDDPWVRRAAADALGSIGDPRALAPLTVALQDGDTSVRASAARALGRIGDPGAEEPLIAIFNRDEGTSVCEAAVEALGEIGGGHALELLIAALTDRRFETRRAAAAALGQWCVRQPEPGLRAPGVAPLVSALHDHDAHVRDAAVRTLVKVGLPAVEPLVAALGGDDWQVRGYAARVLGQIGDARAVEPLIAALGDEMASVRDAAVAALGQIGDARAVEPLIAALGDEMGDVRQPAAVALGRIGLHAIDIEPRSRIADALAGALESPEARAAAALGLGRMGDARAVEPLVGMLELRQPSGSWKVRKAAAETLAALVHQGGLDEQSRLRILAQRECMAQPHTDQVHHTDFKAAPNCAFGIDETTHTDEGIGVTL
jgi:HEAT repeat protein